MRIHHYSDDSLIRAVLASLMLNRRPRQKICIKPRLKEEKSGHISSDILLIQDTILKVISTQTRDSVSWGYPNTEKRVENATRSGVFLTKFEVFG